MFFLYILFQEVEDLKAELEACEQKLDSKYKAIDILRRQVKLIRLLNIM